MKTGDKVKTPNGPGEIITQEYVKGALSDRYLVKLTECPISVVRIQRQNGGVYFWGKELEVVE